jgi:hypothetical protein
MTSAGDQSALCTAKFGPQVRGEVAAGVALEEGIGPVCE